MPWHVTSRQGLARSIPSARVAQPLLRTLMQEEGAADAAPSLGYNRFVPPGTPASSGPPTRSGCDPTNRSRPEQPTRNRLTTNSVHRWLRDAHCAIGDQRRTPLRPRQRCASSVPQIHRLKMRNLDEAVHQKCIRTVTVCHHTVTGPGPRGSTGRDSRPRNLRNLRNIVRVELTA